MRPKFETAKVHGSTAQQSWLPACVFSSHLPPLAPTTYQKQNSLVSSFYELPGPFKKKRTKTVALSFPFPLACTQSSQSLLITPKPEPPKQPCTTFVSSCPCFPPPHARPCPCVFMRPLFSCKGMQVLSVDFAERPAEVPSPFASPPLHLHALPFVQLCRVSP